MRGALARSLGCAPRLLLHGLGLGVAFAVRSALDFEAAAPPWSVALGFGVSTAVGLISGLWPAIKAARQDPVEALRYE